MFPLVLRLLLFMYTNQTLRVKWRSLGHLKCYVGVFYSHERVKQGGVLSPVLINVYTDVLLLRIQESN